MNDSVVNRLTPRPGLRVLVTAGAGGIGAVIAEAFADAGARVHVCDVDAEAIEQFSERVPGAGATRADVADEAAVERLFAEVRDGLGGSMSW